MSHDFSRVPRAEIPRSSFDRSFGHKTALDSGYLYPIYWDEALPGDTFNVNMTAFGRLATPLRPFMDNVFFNTFFFFVPYRLVWDNFQKFMGEQDNPGDSTDYLVPHGFSPALTGYAHNSIYDYFGLPVGVPDVGHSMLPFRAYNLIWNQWFRDQNLQDSVPVWKGDSTEPVTNYTLLKRGKRHDYFTSALPWPQKGNAVDIPLGQSAPIKGLGKQSQTYLAGGTPVYETGGTTSVAYANSAGLGSSGADDNWLAREDPNNPGFPGIYADLTEASAATINQLRQAFQIQKLLERDARGGTRYTEIVRAHFNVVSPDARLQRPEYLGGGQGDAQRPPTRTDQFNRYSGKRDPPRFHGGLRNLGLHWPWLHKELHGAWLHHRPTLGPGRSELSARPQPGVEASHQVRLLLARSRHDWRANRA